MIGKIIKSVPRDYFHLSVSKAKMFLQCKAKYRFTYIDKLPKKDWDHLIFGKLLHETLERYEKAIISGSTEKSHILMKQCFSDALKSYPQTTKEQKQECFDILVKFLKLRQTWKFRPIAAEKDFLIDIGDKIVLNGLIDLVKEDEDTIIHVADYKSSKSDKYLKKDPLQLQVYSYALFLEQPELKKVRTSYVMLKLDFEEIPFEFSREQGMEVESKFREYTASIREEKLYRPEPSPLCEYCDYIDHCKDGERWLKAFKARQNKNKSTFGETDWV